MELELNGSVTLEPKQIKQEEVKVKATRVHKPVLAS